MQQQHRPLGNTLQRNGHERPQSFPGAKERHESVSKQHRAAQPTGPLAAPYHGAHSAGQRSYPQPSRGNTETTRITQPKRRRPLELSGSDGCGKSPHAHAPAFSFLPPSLPTRARRPGPAEPRRSPCRAGSARTGASPGCRSPCSPPAAAARRTTPRRRRRPPSTRPAPS